MRAGVVATAVEMTPEMLNARRRFARDEGDEDDGEDEEDGEDEGDVRVCVSCGTDISGRPANHTVCFACFRRGSYDSEYDSEYDS